jgi:pSer/pThr/pTyr-binding forkhead associated (FHA) protein
MHDSDELGPELVVSHTGQVFRLRRELVTIGAASDNRIILDDPDVSAYHAEIDWVPQLNGYILRNLGSTGGTFANERPVREPHVLRHGDVLRIGNTLIDYRMTSKVEPVPILPTSDPGDQEVRGIRHPLFIGVLVFLLAGFILACAIFLGTLLLTSGRGAPTVIIQSPSNSAQITAHQEITLRATASGAKDITLLEISVDGALAATATSTNTGGQSSLILS